MLHVVVKLHVQYIQNLMIMSKRFDIRVAADDDVDAFDLLGVA